MAVKRKRKEVGEDWVQEGFYYDLLLQAPLLMKLKMMSLVISKAKTK